MRSGVRLSLKNPSISSNVSLAKPPCLRIQGGSILQSRIVLSTPTGQGPPSSTISMCAPRLLITCPAVVGLSLPDGFADGATKPPGKAAKSLSTGVINFGIRTAKVLAPSRANGDTEQSCLIGATIVSGPGQNFCAASIAFGDKSTWATTSLKEAKCAISGLKCGRLLTANIFATAVSFIASAARPYTVSVGNATSPPAFKHSCARMMSSFGIRVVVWRLNCAFRAVMTG